MNAIAKATNNSFIINNFVMKCTKNIFYLLFSVDSDQKNMYIFSCECPFNLWKLRSTQSICLIRRRLQDRLQIWQNMINQLRGIFIMCTIMLILVLCDGKLTWCVILLTAVSSLCYVGLVRERRGRDCVLFRVAEESEPC